MCGGELDIRVLHYANAERVYKWVSSICFVEDNFAADIRKTQTVSISTNASHDARQDAAGIWCISQTKAEWIHHGDRAGAHRQDVANDSANAGGCALIRLNKGWVVVGFDFEGDCITLADIDNASILTDTHKECVRFRSLLAKLF